jgi:hypothetical protein
MIRQDYTFDQLIWGGGTDIQPDWIHISFHAENNRMEVVKMKVVNGKAEYISI